MTTLLLVLTAQKFTTIWKLFLNNASIYKELDAIVYAIFRIVSVFVTRQDFFMHHC